MSYDVNKHWFYKKKGKKIHLFKMLRGNTTVPTSEGRLSADDTTMIYPDENINNGLRIEYTAFNKPFVAEDPEVTANASLTEVTSPAETSHVNLNRMLSLACVEFVKAMVAEKSNNIEAKEYYMRQFYKKLADNASNDRRMFVSSPQPVISVR